MDRLDRAAYALSVLCECVYVRTSSQSNLNEKLHSSERKKEMQTQIYTLDKNLHLEWPVVLRFN